MVEEMIGKLSRQDLSELTRSLCYRMSYTQDRNEYETMRLVLRKVMNIQDTSREEWKTKARRNILVRKLVNVLPKKESVY